MEKSLDAWETLNLKVLLKKYRIQGSNGIWKVTREDSFYTALQKLKYIINYNINREITFENCRL